MILVPRPEEADEDEIMELALEAGAEDLDTDDTDYFRIYTSPDELHIVKDQLETSGLVVEAAQIEMEPSSTTRLEGKAAQRMIHLMEAFDDHDDVQNVWANFDIDDELLNES
jgi:transcriptional/translational regulatory protein YebC/TACO1